MPPRSLSTRYAALFLNFALGVSLPLLPAQRAIADSRVEEHALLCRFCSQQPAPAKPDSPSYRKYSPDRWVDILHVALDLTPDFEKRTLRGTMQMKFKPIAVPLEELRLDSVDLAILRAASSETGFSHQVTEKEVVLTFSPPIPPGKEASVTLDYSAEPVRGLYFRTESMGYEATHLWTQGEPTESRHWFPSFDHPVEKFTSEVTCHLPAGMVALSNGRQVSAEKDSAGLTAYRWVQEKPHVSYLITLVAGKLAKIDSRHRDIPLEFWATPKELALAANSFRHTGRMMEFFERETGFPYPWAKYGQVAVQDYHWGGMENTSLTTLNHRTLFDGSTENLFNSDSLVAHELAHQWFGDLVTCRDWNDIWLNEGFATYYDWLWHGDFLGHDVFNQALWDAAKGILANTNETRGVVWRKFNEPGEMFNYLAYPKGAWVLHMLRCQIGPDLYRKAIQTYLERNAFGSVSTDQLRSVFEEVTGRSFERYFDQWLHGAGAPTLDVAYAWDDKARLAKITVKQTQKISEEAHLFQFPLAVRFSTNGVSADRTMQIHEKEETFFFPLAAAPDSVSVDPRLEVLAKINFKPPRAMTLRQLQNNGDMLEQLRALELLADKPDTEAVSKIATTLKTAPHYGVRIRAAEVLRVARTPEALTALQEALTEADARVRNAVVKAIGGWFDPAAMALLQTVLATEKNPGITATALRALAPYQTPAVREILASHLSKPSFKERITEGALDAMKAQDDPGNVPALLEAIGGRLSSAPSNTLASALEALGALQRNETARDTVREVLLAKLQHPREAIRLASIQALGSLEDPRAIPMLETYSGASTLKPEKAAAQKAIEKIRAAHKPSEELKTLRAEVAELLKTGGELKKELETLKKKIESKP
jgi:aminopeptidase N